MKQIRTVAQVAQGDISISGGSEAARMAVPGAPSTSSGQALRASRVRVGVRWGLLAGVMLLGLAVRLNGLTDYGIWWDEAYHVQLVRLPDVGSMLDAVLSNPPSDPLYVLVLRLWAGLFGTGDAALRLLSVIFGTLTIPATCWLGRVLAGWKVGLLGALLFALSPYALELNQEGALYALAALTTTMALAAGWRWRATGRGSLLYVGLGVAAVYSHYVAAAILALFALAAWLPAVGPRPLNVRAWVGAHAAILCAWLPWLLALGLHWLNATLLRASLPHRATPDEVLGALVQFSSGSAALLTHTRLLEAAALLTGAGLLIAGWLAGREKRKRGVRVLLVVAAAIFMLPAVVSALSGLWLFVPHFMLFLLPALFCALAAGAVWAFSLYGRGSLAMRLALGGLLVVWIGAQVWGIALFYRYPPHGADGLRDLTAVLRGEVRPADAVLVMPPILTPPLRQYYDGPLQGLPTDFDLRQIYLPFDNPDWNRRARQALDADVQARQRFWLIYLSYDDYNGDFLRGVNSSYQQIAHYHYDFADLYLFGR